MNVLVLPSVNLVAASSNAAHFVTIFFLDYFIPDAIITEIYARI